RPEFINRLDEIIMFKPLTKENISGIIDILISNLNKRIADRDLSISLTDSAKQFIADNGYDPVYGARPLKRYLQKNIETMVAKEILSDKLDAGDHIIVDFENNGLVTRIEH
ncbi:MAG: type VI secretion system ATPase TssH, partial [Lachnospiraceae bacterium]|nr:type VI secretion system ATPase TssH [Lachnospiraceae bacterium]